MHIKTQSLPCLRMPYITYTIINQYDFSKSILLQIKKLPRQGWHQWKSAPATSCWTFWRVLMPLNVNKKRRNCHSSTTWLNRRCSCNQMRLLTNTISSCRRARSQNGSNEECFVSDFLNRTNWRGCKYTDGNLLADIAMTCSENASDVPDWGYPILSQNYKQWTLSRIFTPN